ncbi:MAG: hypothetical protein KJO34_19475, partial [Deltaproteobacteria bacterium]|nr:hypothetical protein [Deltaproteobacteria bacterium]
MAQPEWEELRRQLEISERKRAFLQKRLVQSSSEEDSTLWSYVDLLSLLLILFILFYSHAAIKNVSAKDTTTPQLKETVVEP